MTYSHTNSLFQRVFSIRVVVAVLIVVGLVGLALSTIFRNPYTLVYPSAILGGTCGYVLLRNRSTIDFPQVGSTKIKVLFVMYFLSITVLVIFYHLSGFYRTLPVFFFTFLLYTLTAIICVVYPRPLIGIGLICTSGLINRFTAYYASSLYTGVDIFGHIAHIQNILSSQSLAPLSTDKYFFAPFYHLTVAISDLLFAVPLRNTHAIVTIPVVTIVPVLAVYTLTRKFWSREVGFVASILYVASDFGINWGVHTVPNSFGIVFYGLILLTLLEYIDAKQKRNIVLFVLLFSFLSFTHQLSLFVTMLMVITVSVAYVIHSGQLRDESRNIALIAGIIVFLDFTVTRYTGTDVSFFDVIASQLIAAIASAGIGNRGSFTLPDDPTIYPTGASALSIPQLAGSGLLLLFGIIGTLIWLNTRNQSKAVFGWFALGSIVAISLIITLAGPVVGLRNLLPFRWFGFIYIPLAVLAAPGMVHLIKQLSLPDRNSSIVVVALGLFGVYIALMGATTFAAPDGALFNNAPGAERTNIDAEERALYGYTAEYGTSEEQFVADQRAAGVLSDYYRVQASTIQIDYNEPNSIKYPVILVDREYLHTPQAQYIITVNGSYRRIHGEFPVDEIDPKRRSIIYQSEENSLQQVSGDD